MLWPRMLVPRLAPARRPFPLDRPGTTFFYLARNGIYALAQRFGLAGQEVLVPAYFHGVEVEALVAAGARPRFFPVRAGMRIDPEDVVRSIGPGTRAVYLIHYLGFPGPVEEVAEVCRQRGLLLIEDCALALLSRLGERPLGSFGDASIFCLYKTLPTPDGGAVALRVGSLGARGVRIGLVASARSAVSSLLLALEVRHGSAARRIAGRMRAAGRGLARVGQEERVPVDTQRFDRTHARLLMSPTSRLVLATQDYEQIVRTRRRNYLHLESLLRDLAPPVFPSLPAGVCPLFYPFVTPAKVAVWSGLRARGVEAVDFWRVSHLAAPPTAFPEVDELRQTVLELPCHQDLTPELIERLARTVRDVVREVGG